MRGSEPAHDLSRAQADGVWLSAESAKGVHEHLLPPSLAAALRASAVRCPTSLQAMLSSTARASSGKRSKIVNRFSGLAQEAGLQHEALDLVRMAFDMLGVIFYQPDVADHRALLQWDG